MADTRTLLSSIFERSMSLDRRETGGANPSRAMNLWERMAADLDEIAANTRRGIAGRGSGPVVMAAVARMGRKESGRTAGSLAKVGRRELSPGRAASVRRSLTSTTMSVAAAPRAQNIATAASERAGGAKTAPARQRDERGRFVSKKTEAGVESTLSQRASSEARAERAAERQGGLVADAVSAGLGKLRGLFSTGKEAVKENSNLKDAVGLALGGPLYSVVKELKEAMPDSVKNAMDERKARKEEARDIARAVNGDGGRERDDKGRYKPDQDTARRETAQIEVAQAELALEEREAKADAKRHKELVRAVKANHRGLLDRFMDARMLGRRGRDRIIREGPRGRGTAVDVERRRRGGGRDVDIDVDGRHRARGRGRPVAAEIDPRRGVGRAGARSAGRKGLLGGLAAVGGGMGRAVAGAGRAAPGVLAMGGRAAGGLLRALPGIGQMLALGMAAYDGFQGWNDKDLHREAFGLKEGQEATTGQKAAAAGASILDMGGLTSGLLGLFGIEFDKAGVAQGLYQFGTDIAAIAGNFKQEFDRLLPEVWTGIQNLGSQVCEGAKNIGGKLADFAASTLTKGLGLLNGLWDDGKKFFSDTFASIGKFAQEGITGAGNMLSSLWKGATELPGKLVDGVKNLAAGGLEKVGKLASGAWDAAAGAVGSGIDWAKEKGGAVYDYAADKLKKGWNALTGLIGPSEAHADELPKDPEELRRVTEEAQRRQHDMAQEAQGTQVAQQAILPASQKEALPPTTVPTQPTAPIPPAPVMPSVPTEKKNGEDEQGTQTVTLPPEQTHLLSEGNREQHDLNENIEGLAKAVKDQNRLLDEYLRMQGFTDEFGVQGAIQGVGDAIRNMRFGGGGYSGGGASYAGTGGGEGRTYAYADLNKGIGENIARFESGGKGVTAVAYDSTGGTSYGKFQLSSKTAEGGEGSMQGYLRWMQAQGGEKKAVADRLLASGPVNTGGKTGAFVDQYQKEVAANRQLLESSQHEYMLRKNYSPAVGMVSADLRKRIEGSKALQEAMFSTAVQHGAGDGRDTGAGASNIWNKVWKQIGPNASDEDLLKAVYAERRGRFGSSTAQVQAAISTRYDAELPVVLGMLRQERSSEDLRKRMANGGEEAVQAGMSNMVAAATQDAIDRGVKYKMGAKDSAAGQIDCSGWVQEMGNHLMADMNAAIGEEVFSKDARRAFNQGAAQEGAAGIIRAVGERTGHLYTNEQLAPDQAREGMVIGLAKQGDRRVADRFKGIGHIVQTYRDPGTGELMVSESRGGGRGVMRSRYADWYAEQQRRGISLYGADLTAMADAGKVRPAQPPALADSAQSQAQQPQPVADAANAVKAPGEQSTAVARSALTPQALQSVENTFAAASAVPTRKPERVESVRVIDPERDARPGGGSDNSALLAMLGKILTAIEANGRRAAAMAKGGGGDGTPSISTEYDDPAAQGMAKDTA